MGPFTEPLDARGWTMGLYNLESIFDPQSVAVVGASEKQGSIGRALMVNLKESGYSGEILPINPHYSSIYGYLSYTSISEIGREVELAVIATPIRTVPSIIRECVGAGVKGAIIISAGGKEAGDEGQKIEEEIETEAREGGLRIIGPNCLGIIRPKKNLNASFAPHTPREGSLAFISQSGAICTGMLDLALKEKMGFSYFVSIGSMLDVDFADLMDYISGDPQVASVLLYIESLTHFRKFMSAARAISRVKPLLILKSGRSPAGAKAAASHTGAMAGEDAAYDAAFRRAGAVRVYTLEDFFNCAELLAKQPRPSGPRVTIITNSGGPGVMATDTLYQYGLQASKLENETLQALDKVLPAHWSHSNPIDILGDATPKRYADAVECCLKPEEMDGMLLILNPQAMTDPAEVAEAITEVLHRQRYPVFTAWMGGTKVERGIAVLNRAGIPTYDTPEQAIRSFMYLYTYSKNLEMLQQTPPKLSGNLEFDQDRARAVIQQGLERKNGSLTEVESKSVLQAYGLPVHRIEVATSLEEALSIASDMGFPLVMKVHSLDLSHKSDVGGVKLGLQSSSDVREAYQQIMEGAKQHRPDAEVLGVTLQPMIRDADLELLVGAKKDQNFGPILLFGTGGIFAEVLEDRNLGLPPMNRLLARALMEGTKVYRILRGFRNYPGADLERLEELIIRLSQLTVDFPEIVELDMNPVILQAGLPRVADARIAVRPSEVSSPHHLVISPYPQQYEQRGVRADGMELFLRPIKPEDAPLLVDLFNHLSAASIYYRFFSPLKSLPTPMLARFTQIDYDREIALVALDQSGETERILGVARIVTTPGGNVGEFAVAVGDPWQGKGIGAQLLSRCLRIALSRGMKKIWGIALRENKQMLRLGRQLGFQVSKGKDADCYELTIDLTAATLDELDR